MRAHGARGAACGLAVGSLLTRLWRCLRRGSDDGGHRPITEGGVRDKMTGVSGAARGDAGLAGGRLALDTAHHS